MAANELDREASKYGYLAETNVYFHSTKELGQSAVSVRAMRRGRSITSGERHRVKELMHVSHGRKNAEVFYSMTSERDGLGKQQDVSALELS